MDVERPAQGEMQHPARNGRIGQLVDQDEPAERPVGARAFDGIWLEDDLAVGRDHRHADPVEVQRRRRELLERVDVDLVLRVLDGGRDRLRPDLHPVAAAGQQLMLVHPDDRRLELVGGLKRVVRGDDHVPSRAVDLVGQRHRHRLAGNRLAEVVLGSDDPPDPGRPAGRKDPHLRARAHRP